MREQQKLHQVVPSQLKVAIRVQVLAEMIAVGLDLPRDTFTAASRFGYGYIYLSYLAVLIKHLCRPHLLAPTASDLRKYGLKEYV